MKLYKIRLIGEKEVIICDQDDVAKVVQATQAGAKLVRVRSSLINPSSIASITRDWSAHVDELELDSPEMGKLTGEKLLE